jgi:hypothetical protein
MSCLRLWTVVRALLALIVLLATGQTASGAPVSTAEPARTSLWLPMIARADPFIKQQFIGTSVGKRAMYVYRFGHGEHKRLIVGGIHGGYEWNTIELVNMLMEHARANPELIPSDQTLYFLPVLNPDGEARSHWIQGRANDHNVDINRNFDFNWKLDWYRVGCWNYLPITAGTGPFSEIEAEAFRDFVLDYQIKAIISYHSSGAEIYAGGKPPDPASLDLALALARASGYAYPPRASTCEETGQMIDWASAQGIAAVDVELAYHQSIDYDPNQRILETFLNWVMP